MSVIGLTVYIWHVLELETALISLSSADMKTIIQLYRAKIHVSSVAYYATTMIGGRNK
jgi:hypothetical protein